MPTFFSKILHLGKDKEKDKKNGEPASPTSPKGNRRVSIHSLLEGKFEAVSPTVSEQDEADGKLQQQQKGYDVKDGDREKDKSSLPLLYRPKSRTKSPSRRSEDVPRLTLTLNLPSVTEASTDRRVSPTFKSIIEGVPTLDDATLGVTRLSPQNALKLMKACAASINSRGAYCMQTVHIYVPYMLDRC